ncbi:hypothetical protein GCM10027289_08080 [Tsukamurella serpentis]
MPNEHAHRPVPNRAARRHAARSDRRWSSRTVAAAAAAAMISSAGLGIANAADPATPGLPELPTDLSKIDIETAKKLLENPLVKEYVTLCGSGAFSGSGSSASGEGSSADCTGSQKAGGTGIAVVIPENLEVGTAAEKTVIDLGPDINLLVTKFKMGERNLIEIVGGAAVNPKSATATLANLAGYGRVDPNNFDKYKTYAAVVRDASLPVEMEKYCTGVGSVSSCWFGSVKERDKNLPTRTEALNVAQFLTGYTYDPTKPVALPGKVAPKGSAAIDGPGIGIAMAMTGGNATATTKHKYSVATAAASGGRTSTATSYLGIANALDADTDKIELLWFGKKLDFQRLRDSGALKSAGDKAAMIDQIEKLKIPALKEVSCYGVSSSASASGLGECGNYLGVFDYYKDLRPAAPGSVRTTSWGLTDPSSLVFGKNALAKQFLGASESKPFMDGLLATVTSEDKRLKFANDFLRLSKSVSTDAEGASSTSYALTSDYGLRAPVSLDWLGYRVVFFSAVDVNGVSRPNYFAVPLITKIEGVSTGVLPTVSLIELDNPFGFGTLPITPRDPIGGLTSWAKSVTVGEDLKFIGEQLPKLAAGAKESAAPAAEAAPEVAPVTASAPATTESTASSSRRVARSLADETPTTDSSSSSATGSPSTGSGNAGGSSSTSGAGSTSTATDKPVSSSDKPSTSASSSGTASGGSSTASSTAGSGSGSSTGSGSGSSTGTSSASSTSGDSGSSSTDSTDADAA